jgi:hypothetical protein
MFMTKARAATLSAGFLLAFAGLNPALADVPAAMDRVPTNAAMIVTIRDMEQFRARAEDLAKVLHAPIDKDDEKNPVNMTKKLLAADGLDKHGSLAVAVMPDKEGKVDLDQKEGPVVIVIPVKDYAAFAKGLGATETTGIASIKVDDKPAFTKDLGGGFAAMSPHKDLLEAFDGKAGNTAKHKTSLGKSGQQIADTSDLMFVVSVEGMKAQLEQGVSELKENMKMGAAMAQQGAEQVQVMTDLIATLADAFVRDAQVGVVGLGLGEKGVSLDFGAQYKEGTPSAKLLSHTGNASKFLARVPNQAFLFAVSMDLSSPAIKQVVKDMTEAASKAGGKDVGGLGSFTALKKTIDKVDGTAMMMGASPAGIMGLFANTCTFISTSDPAGYVKASRDALKEMDGKEVNGLKAKVEVKPEDVEISGVKADTWTLTLTPGDQNDPSAAQVQMMMPMLFGGNGPGGMTAPVEGGVVQTLSSNTPLFTKALDAAKTGKGLSEDESVKDVQKSLPANRTFEVFLGTKSILDAVSAAMGMFGGGVDLKVPAKVSHVGLGASTEGGGIDFRVFVPADVIKTVAGVVESVKGEGEGADDKAPAGDKPKSPRF